MALKELNVTFKASAPKPLPVEWKHSGVVGSGDMEVLMEKADLAGEVKAKVVTPVIGFDKVWEKVLGKFVEETGLADATIEINDNNATPIIVSVRMRQALQEAIKEAE